MNNTGMVRSSSYYKMDLVYDSLSLEEREAFRSLVPAGTCLRPGSKRGTFTLSSPSEETKVLGNRDQKRLAGWCQSASRADTCFAKQVQNTCKEPLYSPPSLKRDWTVCATVTSDVLSIVASSIVFVGILLNVKIIRGMHSLLIARCILGVVVGTNLVYQGSKQVQKAARHKEIEESIKTANFAITAASYLLLYFGMMLNQNKMVIICSFLLSFTLMADGVMGFKSANQFNKEWEKKTDQERLEWLHRELRGFEADQTELMQKHIEQLADNTNRVVARNASLLIWGNTLAILKDTKHPKHRECRLLVRRLQTNIEKANQGKRQEFLIFGVIGILSLASSLLGVLHLKTKSLLLLNRILLLTLSSYWLYQDSKPFHPWIREELDQKDLSKEEELPIALRQRAPFESLAANLYPA